MFRLPKAKYALIGGSGTWGARFPEDLELPEVELLQLIPRVSVPSLGLSSEFKLLRIHGENVLRVAMHGCYPKDGSHIPPWISSHQVAWVFKEAGVKYVLVEASVGGIQGKSGEDLPPWSVVILNDFIMPWAPPNVGQNVSHGGSIFYRVGQPFCPTLQKALYISALESEHFQSTIDDGLYICTPSGRFESSAEIDMFKSIGGNVVGQTIAHEALALRAVGGIHFGALTIVSNYAENGNPNKWTGNSPKAMADFYKTCPPYVAETVVQSLISVMENEESLCSCEEFSLEGMDNFPVKGA